MQAIELTRVVCTDGEIDYKVGLNNNTNTDDKVQAFVDAFRSVAGTTEIICYGLPVKVSLAIWEYESGWATGSIQNTNQKWSNMIYTSSTNPEGNIGQGKNGWAKFEGRRKHARCFAKFLTNNSRYEPVKKRAC